MNDDSLPPDSLKAVLEAARRIERENEALRVELASVTEQRDALERQRRALQGEVEVLLARITELVGQLAEATDRKKQTVLQLEISRLQQTLAAKNAEIFGSSKSERRGRGDKPANGKDRPKQPGHGPNPQRNLPIELHEHVVDEPDLVCPACGDGMSDMGATEDTEQITIIERKVVKQVHRRQKVRCQTCGQIDVADAPKPLVPGGRYTPTFAVAVALEKYCDHLPLERQVRRFASLGLEITSQTLWDMLQAVYQLLLPSYLGLWKAVLAQPVVGVDETRWRVMGTGASKAWWVWVVSSLAGVFYKINPTRGKAACRDILQGYAGTVMADGYAVYQALEKESDRTPPPLIPPPADEVTTPKPNYRLATCWDHARRGFKQAEPMEPAATAALNIIGRLYAIDAAAKTAGATREEQLKALAAARDTQSRAVIAELEAWLKEARPTPNLRLAKAITYLKNQWKYLVRFLDDATIPLANSASERAMRGPVQGRKNHYGSRSAMGTQVAALMYSLVETCKQLGVDPRAYLTLAVERAHAKPGTVTLPTDLLTGATSAS